ncbi:MAG TPA: protein-glutamate O-methyltransferase CheR [Verrucomicrobiae bacterium]|nr:protein-glutamate O-methyltransferase CheR [Verrucomicrobiae bacterium]
MALPVVRTGIAAAAPCRSTASIETELLQEALFRCCGFDFRDYSFATFRRRVRKHVAEENLASVSALQANVLHDAGALQRFLHRVASRRTAMFLDPQFFLSLRREVFPLLREKPVIRIWHAGCSTGEEVFSLAIMLHEEGLLEKTRIYATDINEASLARARQGIIALKEMRQHTENYRLAGGNRPFSDYYAAAYGLAIFSSEIRKNIIWGRHDLACDGPINTFDVIICRNVISYFNAALQHRVLELLTSSLEEGGVLALGRREAFRCDESVRFTDIDPPRNLYRKADEHGQETMTAAAGRSALAPDAVGSSC